MNAIILKGAALRQPPIPQSGPRAKTIAHPWPRGPISQLLVQANSCKVKQAQLQCAVAEANKLNALRVDYNYQVNEAKPQVKNVSYVTSAYRKVISGGHATG
jgi:hypothetical protein